MTDRKHTPGPWVWNDTWLDGKDGEAVLDYAGCSSHECKVNDANARLISAAPELLEALKGLLNYENLGAYARSDVRKQARAAIAKATGA